METDETTVAPSASAVSQFMGRRFVRSHKLSGLDHYSEGFTAYEAMHHNARPTDWAPGKSVDWVTVEYEPGAWKRARMDETRLLEKTQQILAVYERNLATAYDVAHSNEDGPDDWNCLLVRVKKTEG